MSGECPKCSEHCLDCKCDGENKRSVEYFMTRMVQTEFQRIITETYTKGYAFNMIVRENK